MSQKEKVSPRGERPPQMTSEQESMELEAAKGFEDFEHTQHEKYIVTARTALLICEKLRSSAFQEVAEAEDSVINL